MTVYVQRNGQGYLKTVDQFETWKEACTMIEDYRLFDPSADYYLSRRPCKAWKDSLFDPRKNVNVDS